MLQRFYDSAWQFPLGILLLQIVALAWIVWRRRSLSSGPPSSRWLATAALLLQLVIIADNLSKVPAVGGSLATFFGVSFVIIGDLRFLLLVERWGHRDTPSLARWLGLPTLVAFIVPTASWLIIQQAAAIQDMRVLFVVHEAMFAMLALGMLLVTLSRADLAAARRRWLVGLCIFEAVQYLLWASSDVIIMFGHDLGFGLRVIPNILYYVAFVPFVVASAPEEA